MKGCLRRNITQGGIVRSVSPRLIIGLFITLLLLGSCSPATPPSITMATDKMQYVWGDIVKLEVKNSLDISIWYLSYPQQRDLVFWELERAQDRGWENLDFRLPLIEEGNEVCRMILYEQPIGVVAELKPNSHLLYEWNQRICPLKGVTEAFEPELIERGRYRFALSYSLNTVKSTGIETEPWIRPIDLGETKVVYSNEFVLE